MPEKFKVAAYRKFLVAAAAAGVILLQGWLDDHALSPDEITGAVIAGLGALGVVVVRNKPQPPA
jgi:hypothetical protein